MRSSRKVNVGVFWYNEHPFPDALGATFNLVLLSLSLWREIYIWIRVYYKSIFVDFSYTLCEKHNVKFSDK